MPVTKTAKRALRSSKRKENTNKKTLAKLEIAVRNATKDPSAANLNAVYKEADIAAKKNVIHANKASNLKSRMSKTAKPQKKSKKAK